MEDYKLGISCAPSRIQWLGVHRCSVHYFILVFSVLCTRSYYETRIYLVCRVSQTIFQILHCDKKPTMRLSQLDMAYVSVASKNTATQTRLAMKCLSVVPAGPCPPIKRLSYPDEFRYRKFFGR